MPTNLVTCFLPVYNAERYLSSWWDRNGRELQSVGALLLVVDNGSTDGTVALVNAFEYENKRIIRHQSNLGLERSFQTAKSVIDSRYRFFLPADDWLAPGYLEDALRVMESEPTVGVAYGQSYMVEMASGAVSRRTSPWRSRQRTRENPLNSFVFNNYIPDISLYRSDALDLYSNSWSWFKAGLQASVLAAWDVFYTGNDQCFSGKSPEQVSKEWTKTGRYYSLLTEAQAEGRRYCCNGLADEILWYLVVQHFHTGEGLVSGLGRLDDGGTYARGALEIAREEVLWKLGLMLVDDLLVEPELRKFRNRGRLGTFDELKRLLGSVRGSALEQFRLGLHQRGAEAAFS